VNVCRHRGALLEEKQSGRCRLFSCGYHRWSYNTDGSLRAEEDPGEADLGPHVTEGHFRLPNSTLLRQPDDHFELLTFRPHPADPGRSRKAPACEPSHGRDFIYGR
jgi:Rieske [2Fe-2S] domain